MAQKLTPQQERQAAKASEALDKKLATARREAKTDGVNGWNRRSDIGKK